MQSKPTDFETNLVFLGIIPGFARPPGEHGEAHLLSDVDLQYLLWQRAQDGEPPAERARSS